jgi:hypothetical protein
VELARRFWIVNYGITFDLVPDAFSIFGLKGFYWISNGEKVKVKSVLNGSLQMPHVGSLLIWKRSGLYKDTSHVAVIVKIEKNFIEIVEQNNKITEFPRRIFYKKGDDGGFVIDDVDVLGWTNLGFTT